VSFPMLTASTTRRVAAVAVAAAIVLGTSGCTFFARQATLIPYQPSDGVAAHVGDVKFRNIIGLSKDGKDVALVFSTINESQTSAAITIQYDAGGEKQTRTIFAGSGLNSFGAEGEQIVLRGIDAEVGSLVPIYFQYGDNEGQQVLVPVTNASLEEHEGLLPSPEPTPAPTKSAKPAEPTGEEAPDEEVTEN
jgi:hypothetical protein